MKVYQEGKQVRGSTRTCSMKQISHKTEQQTTTYSQNIHQTNLNLKNYKLFVINKL